jgi:hypothetical protein
MSLGRARNRAGPAAGKPHRRGAILDRGWIDHGKCPIRREELSDILIFFNSQPEIALGSVGLGHRIAADRAQRGST